MKNIAIPILFLYLFFLHSCNDFEVNNLNQKDRKNNIQKLFRDSLSKNYEVFYNYYLQTHDSINFYKVNAFIEESYYLFAMEEPNLSTEENKKRECYRLLRVGFHKKPVLYLIEKSFDKYTLTIKFTNGIGMENSGVLDKVFIKQLNKEDWDSVQCLILNSNFWSDSINRNKGSNSYDGESWFLEGLVKERYSSVFRLAPSERQFLAINSFFENHLKSICFVASEIP